MNRLKEWGREHLREVEFVTLASIVLALVALFIYPQVLILLAGGLVFWVMVSLIESLIKAYLDSE